MFFKNKFISPLLILLTFLASGANFGAFAHDHSQMGHGEQVKTPVPIGGEFSLTDQHGNTIKESDFRGKLMLIFFGYTHCPDICPVSVVGLSRAMELLGDKADQVAPVFVTVDPARDTQAVLKDYLANFDPRIVALTGTPEAIKKAADAYKIYFSVAEASKKKEGNYLVDHSTIIYLMDKKGHYVRHFPYNAAPDDIAAAVREQLK